MTFTILQNTINLHRNNDFMWKKLIGVHGLTLGKPCRFTSKNITQYLLGNRNNQEYFKITEIKHLILRISPLINNLFYTKIKHQTTFTIAKYSWQSLPKKPKNKHRWVYWKPKSGDLKIKNKIATLKYKTIEKQDYIKILFATINPDYSELISDAAYTCNMFSHTNRWLCGAVTANSLYWKQRVFLAKKHYIRTNPLKFEVDTNVYVRDIYSTRFKNNKEHKNKRYKWRDVQGWYDLIKQPTLAIIPDIHNNPMILRELTPLDIPIIGLINSDCSTKIPYPIFGNADSLNIVTFFVNFLSALISKTISEQEYRRDSHRIFAVTRIGYKKLTKKSYKIRKDFQTYREFIVFINCCKNLNIIPPKFSDIFWKAQEFIKYWEPTTNLNFNSNLEKSSLHLKIKWFHNFHHNIFKKIQIKFTKNRFPNSLIKFQSCLKFYIVQKILIKYSSNNIYFMLIGTYFSKLLIQKFLDLIILKIKNKIFKLLFEILFFIFLVSHLNNIIKKILLFLVKFYMIFFLYC